MLQSLRIASRSAALALLATLFACLPLSALAATTSSHGDIVVVTVHGTVDATMAGMTVPLSAGAILQLPATVRTGADGAVELRQGNSTFAAASNTELEIPQSAAEDGLVERIVQIRGNAFYSIGKRTGTRLRVEAPYLVAVIKGTQFNVAAQEDSTTIALFEGHLEVRASDESDVVNIDAGEIAIRHRNDVSISVLRLNAARRGVRGNQELAARPQAAAPNSTSDVVTVRNDADASRPQGDAGRADGLAPVNGAGQVPGERGEILEALPDQTAEVTAKTSVEIGSGAATAGAGVGIDLGGVNAEVNTSASIDLPAGNVNVNAGVTAGVGEVANVDVGAAASVDVPAGAVSVDAGATVAAGNVAAVDVGTAAAVNVPAGTVDVGAGASLAAGNVAAVDVGATTAVDVPAGTANVGVDTSVANTDVGATLGVDAGAGHVGADVNVGPVGVGVSVGSGGLDLDLGGLLGGRKHRD
jgi:hypothetical protein